jgi:phage protein D
LPPKSTIPDATVQINDSALPPGAYEDLVEVTVQDDIEAPSMFTLRLNTWDKSKQVISWADSDLFALGGSVEIRLGTLGSVAPVMKGEITGLEMEVAAGEVPMLVVRGYDRRHRLLRGTRTRSFVQMKDSDIAAQIAQEANLRAAVVDSKLVLEYVLQHEQSDLEFLIRRASAIGYEVVVEDKTLRFRPHGEAAQPAFELAADKDLLEFAPRLTARGQAGEVKVLGWSVTDKKAIVGKAPASAVTAMGKTVGPAAADKAFSAAVTTFVREAVATQEQADALAAGAIRNMALGFIQGEGACVGRPDLKAGIVIKVTGMGERFSGAYYVTSTTHTFAPRQGYKTVFSVRRNAT